ncbi:hypothetical protein B0H14DRAFT_2649232 [Mycena olivaceomarginata]|nr:hypothetical protein B0H14DRAFT_2649232 [Mycena olivaceomarginata]
MSSEPPPSSSITESVTQKLTHSILAGTLEKAQAGPDEEETYKSYGRHLVLSDYVQRKKNASNVSTKAGRFLLTLFPGFREEMISLGGNVKLHKKVCKEIQKGLDGARGDDTNKMKPSAINWLMKIQNPRVSGHSKVHRLISMFCLGAFVTRIKARDKQFPINGKIPAFMYPTGHMYDDLDIEDKLLEGCLPIAAAKQIYQGPSAALQTPGYHRGRAGNAAHNGQDCLGLHDVVYVCTQGGEGQAILDIFNYHVFGTQSSNVNAEEAVTSAAPSGFDLLAQRTAKCARLSAATASTAP